MAKLRLHRKIEDIIDFVEKIYLAASHQRPLLTNC
jgi:hypothetical protein